MKKYKFLANIKGKEILSPKGFYYQGNYIILVGDAIINHTIRRKEKIEDVEISILEVNEEKKVKVETTRTKALTWWNSLPDFQNPAYFGKHGLCTKYYNGRMFQTLTGREIENIWKNEV